MKDFSFFENFIDAVCVFDGNGEIFFANHVFLTFFKGFKTISKLKKHFNFNICFLNSEDFNIYTPLDFVFSSKESFHTVCSFQNINEEYSYFYLHSFILNGYKVLILKDITNENILFNERKKLEDLTKKYKEEKDLNKKFAKLQENSQAQVLKMAIINRISLVIRETNNIENILDSTLFEIHNLLGSYKTYFSVKDKNAFKIRHSVNNSEKINTITEYEEEVIKNIRNKDIVLSLCLKEFLNAETILPKSVNRIIIPIYNKNKLLGIIVTFTKHKFLKEENNEILQSIAVQLSSSIIQSNLFEQLKKKNKKLEKTLSELKETQIQLINTEKMASVGQLVAGVAHEINTPLASINSNNKIIEKLLNKENILSSKNLQIIKELNNVDNEAINRISNIVKSLKRFVRLDEAEFQEADINKEIDLTLKLITHELKDNIKIVKNYSQIPQVMCSVNMLNQVFMNLLVNACHSIPNSQTGEIIISTEINNQNLTVKIKDNGTGIPQNVQNKIFNVGFTTKKIGIGTGFGLSISKKIIELHKGSISFTSKEGVGTEFVICIPI